MTTRRRFLRESAGLGFGLGALSVGAPTPGLWQRAAMAAESRADLPILVVVELTGGNDGLNTVIPHADDAYHRSRPTLRVDAKKVLRLDDRVGLHPALKDLHRLWESGDLAVVQGVGYPAPDRSHFRSMAIWQTGTTGHAPSAGWLGRAADLEPGLRTCHVGPKSMPQALVGRRSIASALASLDDYHLAPGVWLGASPAGTKGDPAVEQVRRQFAEARDLVGRIGAIPASTSIGRTTPAVESTLEGRLETIHRLILTDSGHRVYYTSLDGFDTHAAQGFRHQALLRTVAQGVSGFLTGLAPGRLEERVVLLLFSEFGRRLSENASGGTDHGTAAPVLLAGKSVRGGLIGPPPDLSRLDDVGDPRFTTDFRDVYAAVLRRWLRVDPEPILGRRDREPELFG
ncbi:MAG: DUF1501 domain-containing protein [Isosphaeraceae bacterium]